MYVVVYCRDARRVGLLKPPISVRETFDIAQNQNEDSSRGNKNKGK
jgi:hypothetical protein